MLLQSCLPELWVVTVRTVRRPTEILAGTWMGGRHRDRERKRERRKRVGESLGVFFVSVRVDLTDLWSIQNETKERITMSIDGI